MMEALVLPLQILLWLLVAMAVLAAAFTVAVFALALGKSVAQKARLAKSRDGARSRHRAENGEGR